MTTQYSSENPNPITKPSKPAYVRERIARNPLTCEKTPRTHFQQQGNWNYNIPKNEQFPDKWNYNIEEKPLIEKFESLVDKVAREEKEMEAYNTRIKKFQETQALLASQPVQITVRESARSTARESARNDSSRDKVTARTSSRVDGLQGTGRVPASITERSTSRSENPFSSSRSAAQSEKDLTSFPVTSLKTLQHEHPDILAKMRAQRATKYVTSLRNPLEPPAYNSVSSRKGFFPAGTNNLHDDVIKDTVLKKKSNHEGATKSTGSIVLTTQKLDTARMKESLNTLVEELAKTNSEIQRQELKIALAPKVKTFEKSSKK